MSMIGVQVQFARRAPRPHTRHHAAPLNDFRFKVVDLIAYSS